MSERKQEFWRWTEDCVVDPDLDWREAEVITLGVDVGSVSSEALVCLDGKLYAYNTVRTGANSPESAQNAMRGLFEKTGLKFEDVHYTVGTGYGRVNIPFAGFADFLTNASGWGITVTYDGSDRMVLNATSK
ncbi:MAG: benzoyl-CoA reductase, bzd-type, subunit Q, partial [Deltaproteobacteria bacterium]|nr:benzoyl-CoA reductase, bzd-type, subunit Q [Deltaproteobacteria bacterium]